MNFTVTEILTIVGTIIALITAVRAGRNAKVENQKTQAETAKLYQDIADACAEAKAELIGLVDKLRGDLTETREQVTSRDARIEALEAALITRDNQIAELRRQLNELNDLVAIKDQRIDELERLTSEQTSEIEHLRVEIESLRRRRKQ